MANAVFFETASWERQFLRRALRHHGLRVQVIAEALTEETRQLASTADILSVFIYSRPSLAALR